MHPHSDTGRPQDADKVEDGAEVSKEDPNRTKKETDRELDHGLKETFPASDPVSINPGAD